MFILFRIGAPVSGFPTPYQRRKVAKTLVLVKYWLVYIRSSFKPKFGAPRGTEDVVP